MSDDFIPLNQSTPVGGNKWQGRHNSSRNQYQNHSQNSQRRGYNNRWGNNSQRNNSWGNSQRNSSYGSDSNNSFSNEKSNIDAYLHPSMLQDPWAQLRSKQDDTK